MLQRAIITASIKDTRTDAWAFQGLEVSYTVNVDTEADEDTQHQQILTTFWENLTKVLKDMPKGTRVINNKKNYGVTIENIATAAIQ